MAATIPTTEPSALRVGDTWQWRREDLADAYPASAWTLKYFFRNATHYFDVTAAADGTAFSVSVAKATTAGYTAGDYDWIAVAESATERFQVDEGRLELKPNLSAAAVFDGRSFARTLLDAVEAALTSKATSGQLDLAKAALSDRSMEYNTAALMTLRSQLTGEVRREEATQNGVDTRRVLVRFG